MKQLDEVIYDRYIKPIKRPAKKYVGLEFEFPVVNLHKKAVDFTVIHNLTDKFIQRFSFDVIYRDDENNIYMIQKSENGEGLSYDCSYNTLELSFGREKNINILYKRFREYYTFIQDYLKLHGHTLTGMGINPYNEYNNNIPIPNGRYRMLFHHLSSYTSYGNVMSFHKYPNFGLFSCASQVQLDVTSDNVVEAINTFTKLEPLKSLLFANSLWKNDKVMLCSRDYFWKNSLQGFNRHNVDMYEVEISSLEELGEYIKSMSIYCVERENLYINFKPMRISEYFSAGSVTGEYYNGKGYSQITFKPEYADIKYLRSFKFVDLTYRGTLEFRSVCEQPVSEIMASGALHTGLMENLHELTELLEGDKIIYHRGYSPAELRTMFNQEKIPAVFERNALIDLIIRVLDIARDGLQKRGMGEEHFLDSLYKRAEQLLSPARQMFEGIKAGKSVEYYIEKFSALDDV